MKHKIICGECVEVMHEIEDKSIDMILCDLPYGTTSCSWDTIIPFKSLWKEYKRIIKDNGAVVLTASQPFTSALVMSNIEMFKYDFTWDKKVKVGTLNCKRMPLRQHEDILVFYKSLPIYNPQFKKGKFRNKKIAPSKGFETYGQLKNPIDNYNDNYYPSSILTFSNANQKIKIHPTQKPVALFEYLIKTYTNEGNLILDNCVGSGTTLVAAEKLGRNSIGIDISKKYCELSYNRLSFLTKQLKMDREPSIIERINF